MTPNEKKLKKADFLGYTVIPTIAGTFVASYWVLGMAKYYFPEVSMEAVAGALAQLINFALGAITLLQDMQKSNATKSDH